MKRILVLLATVALIAALAVTAAAEYVACTTPGEEHAMSEWTLLSTNADGSSVYERICSKCDYHQKGFGGNSPADGVATTRDAAPPEHLAVTTSLDIATTLDAPAANPSTGARA